MGDRDTLSDFIEARYGAGGLDALAPAIGAPCPAGETTRQAVETLLRFAEREGMAGALLARVEADFPGLLPCLTWAGVAGGSEGSTPGGTGPETADAHPQENAAGPDAADARRSQGPLLVLRDGLEELEASRLQAFAPLPTEAPAAPPDGDAPQADAPQTDAHAEMERAAAELSGGLAGEEGEEFEEDAPAPTRHGRGREFRFVHGYTLPTHWARRDAELAELAEAVRLNRDRILSLVAIGGTGKSALARKLVDELPRRGVPLDGALWFSFYVEPDFDRFLTEACRYLITGFDPRQHPSPFEKGVLLRDAMEGSRTLFVLDGIEVLLAPDRDNPDFGTIQDRALRDYLDGVLESRTAQVLISSRFPLPEFDGRAGYRAIKLGDLSEDAADDLLDEVGVQGGRAARQPLYDRFHCHALTLQVLGDFLVRYYRGEPSGARDVPDVPDDAPQGVRLQAVLDGYWKHLTPEERFFLTRMAAFRGGVDERSMGVLNRHGDVFDSVFREMVQRLMETPLVSVERRGAHPSLTAHPLIKTFFYERMGDPERDRTHRALKDYAQGLPVPDKPRTVEEYAPLLDACHHCLQVGLYTEAYQVYRRNNMDNALRWWGHYDEALRLLEPLRDATLGDLPAWQSERWQRSWVENETALLALLRGDVDTAIARFQHSAQMDAEASDGLGESASWQNVASALIVRGDYRAALESLETSQRLEMRLGRYEKEDLLAGLEGVCRAALGEVQEGFDLLTRALGISAQRNNLRAVCYWNWRLGDVYLRTRQADAAREQFDRALQMAKREQFRDYEGHALRGMGDAARLRRQTMDGRDSLDEALRVARSLGNPFLENEVRLSLSRLAELEGVLTEARALADQARARAEDFGYLAQAGDAHLVLARLAREQDGAAYEEHLAAARDFAARTGYSPLARALDALAKAVA